MLTEHQRWFWFGVRKGGVSYELIDEPWFWDQGEQFDAWWREYQRQLSKIKEPRWVPENTARKINRRLP